MPQFELCRRWIAILSAGLAFCVVYGEAAGANASENELVSRRILFADANIPNAKLRPDGADVAFVRTNGAERTLWIGAVDNVAASTRIDADVPGTAMNMWWTGDGARLIVQRSVDNDVHLYSYTVASQAWINLTPLEKVQARFERMSASRPNECLIALNDRDAKVHDLCSVNIETGDRQRIFEAAGFTKVYTDGNFEPKVVERNGAKGVIELLRRKSTDWEVFWTFQPDETNPVRVPGAGVQSVVGVDASGRTLLVVDNVDRDKSALIAIDIESQETKVLIEDADADMRPIALLDRLTGEALGVSAYFGSLRRYALNPGIESELAEIRKQIGGDVGLVDISLSDKAWLIAPLDGGPIRFLAYNRESKTLVPLFSTQPELDAFTFAKRVPHVVTARDGLKLPLQLYLPPGADADGNGIPDKPLPTILYVHGGPMICNPWESWFTNRNFQLLANRRYAVLNVDFRGGGGYGREFQRKGWGEWGGEMQRDFVDIAHWATAQGIAPKEKIAIWGWSYGGLSAFACLSFFPDEFACGISMYGLSDMEAFVRRVSIGPNRQSVGERIGDASTESGRAKLQAQSPVRFAEKVTKPLLVTHGSKDFVVPKSQSDQMVKALEDHGKEVIYLVYPNEPHDYREASSWISFWAVAERFLHEHLGGRYEPYGDDLRIETMKLTKGQDQLPGLRDALPPS